MKWRNVKPLPPPINDKFELAEDREYPLTVGGPNYPFVMRRHRGMLQVRRKLDA